MPRNSDPLCRKATMPEVIMELAKLARTDMGGGMVIAHKWRPFIMMCLDCSGLSAVQIAADIQQASIASYQTQNLGN